MPLQLLFAISSSTEGVKSWGKKEERKQRKSIKTLAEFNLLWLTSTCSLLNLLHNIYFLELFCICTGQSASPDDRLWVDILDLYLRQPFLNAKLRTRSHTN